MKEYLDILKNINPWVYYFLFTGYTYLIITIHLLSWVNGLGPFAFFNGAVWLLMSIAVLIANLE